MAKDQRTELRRLRTTTNLLGRSAYEYVAGRCLEINYFSFIAPPLLVMSIEKILKAIIAERDPNFVPKKLKHSIVNLYNTVSDYDDYDISKFKDYIPKLEYLYNLRYHDNPIPDEGLTIEPVDHDTIDALYIDLSDQIKLIPDIKFRCGLYSIVFDKYDKYRRIKQWAFKDNKALVEKMPQWTADYIKYIKNEEAL